jgi:uncharacterized protein (DUF433 family)
LHSFSAFAEIRGVYSLKNGEAMTKQQLISTQEDVLGGTPVFYGTRVPIKTFFDYLEAGDSINAFLDDFPSVTREQAILFLEYAKDTVVAGG